jgi:hypothetical protein
MSNEAWLQAQKTARPDTSSLFFLPFSSRTVIFWAFSFERTLLCLGRWISFYFQEISYNTN